MVFSITSNPFQAIPRFPKPFQAFLRKKKIVYFLGHAFLEQKNL